jgi:hypothetical protein
MLRRNRWRIPAGIGVLTSAMALCVPAFTTSAGAASLAATTATGPVAKMPAKGTPELAQTGTTTERIRQLVQCGGTMYAAGDFTQVSQNGTDVTRDNLFSFSATSPYTLTSWAPDVNGTVNSIAFNGSNCGDAYIGGTFTEVGSTAVHNLAEVSTSSGAVVTAFGHSANKAVNTMVVADGHLLVGGDFTAINGSGADPYYTSLNLTTGHNDQYLQLKISGHYSYPKAKFNPTRIYNQQVSHSGTRVLVEGDFTSVGGQARQQAFQMTLGSKSGTVNGWNAPVFDNHCIGKHPYYTFAGAWGAGDGQVYFATTGYHVYNWNGTFPDPPPCDMALAFSAAESTQNNPTWSNSTGCYSLFSVAADSSAVYFAGHEDYSNNPNGCKTVGSGAVHDKGLEGLNPTSGKVMVDAKGKGMYSMARANADDMLITSAGLWIASSNRFNANACDGYSGHSGICFLPY